MHDSESESLDCETVDETGRELLDETGRESAVENDREPADDTGWEPVGETSVETVEWREVPLKECRDAESVEEIDTAPAKAETEHDNTEPVDLMDLESEDDSNVESVDGNEVQQPGEHGDREPLDGDEKNPKAPRDKEPDSGTESGDEVSELDAVEPGESRTVSMESLISATVFGRAGFLRWFPVHSFSSPDANRPERRFQVMEAFESVMLRFGDPSSCSGEFLICSRSGSWPRHRAIS